MWVSLGMLAGRTPTQHCPSVYSMCRMGLKAAPLQWERHRFNETGTIERCPDVWTPYSNGIFMSRSDFSVSKKTARDFRGFCSKLCCEQYKAGGWRGDPQQNVDEGRVAVRIFRPAEPISRRRLALASAPLIRSSQESR